MHLSHRNAKSTLQTPICSSNEVSQKQCQYYPNVFASRPSAFCSSGIRTTLPTHSFYSSVHQKAEEEHLKSLSISMNWSDKDIKRSFEKIAPCSCETTKVATAADDNNDFSNTFQRHQAQPINRGAMKS